MDVQIYCSTHQNIINNLHRNKKDNHLNEQSNLELKQSKRIAISFQNILRSCNNSSTTVLVENT